MQNAECRNWTKESGKGLALYINRKVGNEVKKTLFCCVALLLIFALVFPVGVFAAAEPDVPEPADMEEEYPAESSGGSSCGQAGRSSYGPAEYFGMPSLEDWGVDGIDDIIWYMEFMAEMYSYYYESQDLPEDPLWEVLDHSVGSPEEFVEKYDIAMEEYLELEQLWVEMLEEARLIKARNDEWYERYRMEQLESLGGTPGIVNVMVNGDFIKFAEAAVPERKEGHTFVPAKLFFEVLGAEVAFDNETRMVKADFGDYFAVVAIGSNAMIIMKDDEVQGVDIGAAPYISSSGSSYIPVRAVAEALGLNVFWDSGYETVVVIDKAGIIAEIDKDFTVANKLLNMALNSDSADSADSAGLMKTVLSVLATVKLFDSLDGDTDAALGADMTVVTDGQNVNMTIGFKLGGLIDLILASDPYYTGDIDEVLEPEEIELLESLTDAEAELIFNYDKDILYIKAPFLTPLIPELPAGAWISVDHVSRLMRQLFYPSDIYYLLEGTEEDEAEDVFSGGGLSVGELIYSSNSFYEEYSQIRLYDYITSEADDLRPYLGDSKIKVNGNDYTLKLTTEDILGPQEEDDPYYYYYYYRYGRTDLDLEVNIKTDGEAITGISGKYFMRESYYYSSGVTQIKCEFDISPEKVSISFEAHEKNQYVVSVDVDLNTAETTGPVKTAPPEGDKVVPIEELFPDEFEEYGPGTIVPLGNFS